jgi:uncharacterized peroxidase-related enzyme
MSTLAQIEPDANPELFAEVKKAMGVVPNMTKVMANSPAALRGFLALSKALSEGVLPPAIRERLALATAERNGCDYCLSAHSFMGTNVVKIGTAEVSRAREARSADPHAAALLRLSDALVRGQGSISPETLQAVREAGVTDAEITEVVANIALNVFTNYFNIVADTEIDFPTIVRAHGRAE